MLKEFNLSSPRGRRSAPKGKKEKFKIPDYRKEELFPSDKSANDFLNNEQGINHKEKACHCSLAAFLCKIALWEMKSTSFFNKLSDYVENYPDFMKKKEIWEYLFLRKIVGSEEKKEDFYKKNEFFWSIEDTSISAEELMKIEENNRLIKNDFFVKIPEFFKEISCFKLVLENSEEIWIDSEMMSVWTKQEKTKKRVFFYSFLSKFSGKFLNNVQSVVFYENALKIEKNEEISEKFKNFIAAYENIPGKRIKSVYIYDFLGKNHVFFDNLPLIKRFFVMAFWPEQKEYLFFQKNRKFRKKEEIFQAEFSKFAYTEEEIAFFPSEDFQKETKLRAFFLRAVNEKNNFFIIISNLSIKDKRASQIIDDYFSRWGGILKSKNYNLKREERDPEQSFRNERVNSPILGRKKTTNDFFDFLSEHIKNYILNNYFSSENNEIWQKLTSIQIKTGDIVREGNYIKINLNFPPNMNFMQEAEKALLRINEREILNEKGKIVSIKCKIY